MYRVLAYFFQPYTLLLVLIGLAILYLWRTQKEKRGRIRWLVFPFLGLIVLSIPAVSYLALASLEWRHPIQDERPADVEAIVVLGGGVLTPDDPETYPVLDSGSLYRCIHAAKLYHQGRPCPLVVSGGKWDPTAPGPPCSELMRDFLIQLGVRPSDLIVENVSRTTYENAVESGKVLNKRRIMLVTEGSHLHRSVLCFEKQQFDVLPSGCRYRARGFKPSLFYFLPCPEGAVGCHIASHEWVGLTYYWLSGKI